MKSIIKSYGQYFTPKIVVDFMVDLISKPKSAEILEPCAGEGIFLESLQKHDFNNICAIEIDEDLKNISNVPIMYADFLEKDFPNKFDVIIGNPPYVRWKNIPKEIQNKLKNNPFYSDVINGLSDLLYPFIYRSVDLLKPNGELIFITPLFWTTTLHSKYIRKYLTENGSLEVFITFNEMRIFKEVSSNILIFKFIKKLNNTPIKVIHVNSKKRLDQNNIQKINNLLAQLDEVEYVWDDIYEGYQHQQFINSNPWTPLPPHVEPIIQQIEHSCTNNSINIKINSKEYNLNELLEDNDLEQIGLTKFNLNKIRFLDKVYYHPKNQNLIKEGSGKIQRYVRLGDVAYIGNGLVSGLDKAFRVNNFDNLNQSEKKHLIKVVKAKNLDRYFINGFTNYIFLNSIDNESELENFPKIKAQLLENYNELKARYSYNKDIPYWHWVFLRNFNLIQKSKEKIIVPCKERIDKRNYIRFALAEGDYYITQDATAIVKKDFFKEDIRYLLAILNSDLILTWLKYKGLSRGGVLEFSEKPLSMIPIRVINWNDNQEKIIYQDIIQIVKKIIENKSYSDMSIDLERKIRVLYGLQ